MKVLMLNGSCNERGCTYTALEEIGRTLREEGVDCEIFQLGRRLRLRHARLLRASERARAVLPRPRVLQRQRRLRL